MRLLFILQDIPFPPTNGYKQKIANVLHYISQQHHCDIIATGDEDQLATAKSSLEKLPNVRIIGIYKSDVIHFARFRQIWRSVMFSEPPSWVRCRSGALISRIIAEVAKSRYDAFHVDLQGMAQYCLYLPTGRCVLSLNDSMSATLEAEAHNRYAPIGQRLAALLRTQWQLRIDRQLFKLARHVHFVAPYDLNWSMRRFKVTNGIYIPLAVEDSFLRVQRFRGTGKKVQLIIIDKLWAPQHLNATRDFLEKCWFSLSEQNPEANLTIVGGNGIPREFVAYAEALPRVRVVNWIKDLAQAVGNTDIAVFPYSVPVGMKTRVLQCMGAMNAVVGTPNAFAGLPVRDGVDVLIASSIEEIGEAACRALKSHRLRENLGKNARTLVEMNFTVRLVGAKWEKVYESLAFCEPENINLN